MFYTIYKITNKINQKYYIGMHKTNDLDDGYMGSGKLIKQSISKHGIENFTKEILHVYDNEEDMKNKEKELVVINEMSYNLCDGGGGGFSYINSNSELIKKRDSKENKRKGYMANIYNMQRPKSHVKENGINAFINKTGIFSENYKNNLDTRGSKNHQYGTIWISNNFESKKIKKDDLEKWISLGYYKGRKFKKS